METQDKIGTLKMSKVRAQAHTKILFPEKGRTFMSRHRPVFCVQALIKVLSPDKDVHVLSRFKTQATGTF